MRNIVIIGGGLAGLISAIQLVRAGIPCRIIEKKSYPHHRVCGEYVSNEALPFLQKAGLLPGDDMALPRINFFELSDHRGRRWQMPLDLGGFGISRFAFDHFLYREAMREGVSFSLRTEAEAVRFSDEHGHFEVNTSAGTFTADLVVGAFGKRSRIDVQQRRGFISKRSPYVGVKYHVRSAHPRDVVSLHNFPGGYCGVSAVEDQVTNLCYLSHQRNLKQYGDIHEMERHVLFSNPLLRKVFDSATFIFDKPEVISEISFETKGAVEHHMLMAGDAAGMITPLCGNGMAIAIHAGKLIGEHVIPFCQGRISRARMEQDYRHAWERAFRRRLWFGRQVQHLFGHPGGSASALKLALSFRPLAQLIVRNTHGRPF